MPRQSRRYPKQPKKRHPNSSELPSVVIFTIIRQPGIIPHKKFESLCFTWQNKT